MGFQVRFTQRRSGSEDGVPLTAQVEMILCEPNFILNVELLCNYIVTNSLMLEERARTFFQQITSGIKYSHRLKIVHRHLKPENVLLDDDLSVKIADFVFQTRYLTVHF